MKTATTWVIDPSHSEIFFKVRHLVIATVTGSFEKFEGKMISSSDDFNNSEVEFTADVNSLNTNAPDRDKHLKSPDFFDAENFPTINFRSHSFKKTNSSKYKIRGEISIRGVTSEIELDAEYGGAMKDPWGNDRVGFELTGVLNRQDFGLKWNVLTEAGGAVAGSEVKLQLSVELVKQV